MDSSNLTDVSASFSTTDTDSTKSYFLSRDASADYADSMTALTLQAAGLLDVSPQSLLETVNTPSETVTVLADAEIETGELITDEDGNTIGFPVIVDVAIDNSGEATGVQLSFTATGYQALNVLRDPGSQIGEITTVDNQLSLQSRQIRA